jgi:hypothetical protein
MDASKKSERGQVRLHLGHVLAVGVQLEQIVG